MTDVQVPKSAKGYQLVVRHMEEAEAMSTKVSSALNSKESHTVAFWEGKYSSKASCVLDMYMTFS